MKQVLVVLFALSALAKADDLPDQFFCATSDGEGKIQINGYFVLDEIGVQGVGPVVFKFPDREASYSSSKGEFMKGMWMTNRMNLYLRDESKYVIAGVIIDEFFGNNTKDIKGNLYGIFGDRELKCNRIVTW